MRRALHCQFFPDHRTDRRCSQLNDKFYCSWGQLRLTRWYLKIQNFDFTIKYIAGKENIIADVLSRISYENINGKVVKIASITVLENTELKNKIENVHTIQRSDECLKKIITQLESCGSQQSNKEKLYNGVLFHYSKYDNIYKIYIPEILQSQQATLYHEKLGHFGFWKTFKAMTQFYYWKNMRKTVKIVVQTCVICQKSKVPNQTSTGIMKSIIPLNQNELLAVDLFGPLPTSIAGVKYIFVILNVFTKYIKLYKLKKPTTRAIIGKLKNDYFIRVRKPERILSDNGTQFRSKQWDTFLRENHIDNLHCSIRHPQSNPSERTMRELGRLLRVYCHNKHTSWAKYTVTFNL